MASRPLVKESLQMLNICGLDVQEQDIFSNLRAVLFITVPLVILIDTLLDSCFNWQGLNTMEGLSVSIGCYQVVMKILTMVLHRKHFIEVILNMEQFWFISKHGAELQNEIETIYSFARKSVKLLLISAIATAFLFMAQALLSSVKKLPFRSYFLFNLDQSPGYEFMFAFQILATGVGMISFISFDFLFISLLVNTSCELKLLKSSFEKLPINPAVRGDDNKTLAELNKVMDHHNLILTIITSLKRIYSKVLLNIFVGNTVCMCVGLLCIIISTGSSTIQSCFKYGLYVAVFVMQLFFYCVAGSYLTTKSGSISNAIYDTEWWIKTQPTLRKSYVMAIMRANKPEKLTAGGMFDLDVNSFTRVIKAALSFFAVVKAMYRNG